MRLEVLTPSGVAFEGEVDQVVVPLPDGWRGILPGHLPFHEQVMAGVVLVDAGGQRQKIATRGGTIEVERDAVTVLTGTAMVDADLEQMEQHLGREAATIAEMEAEAERQFSRIYHQLARSLKRQV